MALRTAARRRARVVTGCVLVCGVVSLHSIIFLPLYLCLFALLRYGSSTKPISRGSLARHEDRQCILYFTFILEIELSNN